MVSRKARQNSMIARLVIFIGTSLGLVLQLYQISSQYLKSDSVTIVSIDRPTDVKPPKIFFCSNYYEFSTQARKEEMIQKAKNGTLRTSEIFDATPDLNILIEYCRIHNEYGFL